MTTVTKTDKTHAPQGIMMPTQKQLATTYRSMYEAAVKNHSAKTLTRAPAGASTMGQGINITKPGLLGSAKFAYVIHGDLYVKSTIVSPTAKPTWVKVGPAPLF